MYRIGVDKKSTVWIGANKVISALDEYKLFFMFTFPSGIVPLLAFSTPMLPTSLVLISKKKTKFIQRNVFEANPILLMHEI